MDLEDYDAITKACHEAVNMTPAEMERWLGTEDSAGFSYRTATFAASSPRLSRSFG